ncbi:hypothetical protein N7491_004393 [Penicillium cf. griseofulvum]|uniref:Uncharacterized protein n=1 Tax=Penicillium cf. griseofulvum TaxID=2972120 RepID=A0A9W9IZV3_9EURO|nr:hypothetical protein N7472_007083 [Penicillium cf. griseofulvum]KAJ5433798.1 hypothetical protein N7491_004393 [Penicillium cf. griseofulvum]
MVVDMLSVHFSDDVLKEEDPVVGESVVEEPVVEEPAVEEPAVGDPVVEEPVVGEPVAEEPVEDWIIPAASSVERWHYAHLPLHNAPAA